MSAPKNILIAVIGSHGDVHPFIGIGIGLHRRGHRVRVIVNPHFETIVRGEGLEIIPLGEDADYRELASHPDLWHRTRGPRYIFRQIGAIVPRVYQAIVDHHEPGRTVVVHSSLALGARVAQEKLGIPTATVHLQPTVLRSAIAPPVLYGAGFLPCLPIPLRKLAMSFGDRFIIDPMAGKELNEFLKTLGLPRARGIINTWWNSPDRVIGMFPAWYAPPQSDWASQIRLTGFPLYDESGITSLPVSLDEFLRQGTPPIAFTPGSAMWRADEFFAQAAAACSILGRRGLLLSRHADHIPRDLPPGVIHVPYAPFSELLPRCAALVHHGGIGTTAQAMASGIPQLIRPFTHDQPDNAARIVRLGIGRSLIARRFTARHIAPMLTQLLESAEVRIACQSVAKRFEQNDGIAKTCDLIEQLSGE